MKAILLTFGSISLYSFGLLLAFSLLAALFQVWRQARVRAMVEEKVIDAFLLSTFVAVFVGRITFVLSRWDFFGEDVGRIFLFVKYPGLLFGWAIAAGAIFAIFSAMLLEMEWLQILDVFAMGGTLAMPFAFAGCYLDSCFAGWPVWSPLLFLGLSVFLLGVFSILNRSLLLNPAFSKFQRKYGVFALIYLIFSAGSFLIAEWVWQRSWNWAYFVIAAVSIVIFLIRYWGIWTLMKFPTNVLGQIRSYLEKRDKEIEVKIKEIDKTDPVHTEDRNDTASDDMQAQNKAGHERALALKHQLQVALIQTRKALSKIKIGSYGVCENCGKMIDTDRLSVMPTATLCVNCEKKKER